MNNPTQIDSIEEAVEILKSKDTCSEQILVPSWILFKLLSAAEPRKLQPVRYITDEYTGITEPHCPCCDCFIDQYNPRRPWQDVKYCCYCGQEVVWE